jgi:hypothetical protein
MAQAPVQKVSTPESGSKNQLGKFAAFVGAMVLGAVIALAGSAAFAAYQAGAVTTPQGADVATEIDRQVVQHNQSERSESPLMLPAASLRPATDNDRAVVQHLQSERAETPSSGN